MKFLDLLLGLFEVFLQFCFLLLELNVLAGDAIELGLVGSDCSFQGGETAKEIFNSELFGSKLVILGSKA